MLPLTRMGGWWIFILVATVIGTHFFQIGYQGYADVGASLLGGVCLAAAYGVPISYISPTAGVAAACAYLAGSAVYWRAKRRRA